MKGKLLAYMAVVLSASLLLSSCGNGIQDALDKMRNPYEEAYEGAPSPPVLYPTDEAAEAAVARLGEGQDKAEVLSDIPSIGKTLFLTFSGLSDAATMTAILDKLDEREIKATFFLPGIRSAENPETVAEIARRGHEIGNYTLGDSIRMETLAPEVLAEDFARTGQILADLTGKTPDILRCRATEYTEPVLRAAWASGNRFALSTPHHLSFQSFQGQGGADNYILGLERGAVLSVNLDGVLNEYEYQAATTSITTPAPPKADTRNPDAVVIPQPDKTKEERLLEMVDFLLAAIEMERYTVLPASAIPGSVNPDFGIDFSELSAENEGGGSVLTNARTTMRSVALAFSYVPDEAYLATVLDALAEAGITATFYVTAREITDYPERIDRIIAGGHRLENGGGTGEDLSEASFEEVSLEIYQCDKLLEERYGVSSRLFMPSGAKITDAIVEAAAAADYTVATYNRNPVDAGVTEAKTLREYFNQSVYRGDIIFGHLNRYDRWEELIPTIAGIVRAVGYGFSTVEALYAGQYPAYDLYSIPGWNAIHENYDFDPTVPRAEDFMTQVETEDKVMFLTFDDWGSDATVTSLLDILASYGAKATFFVRANGVDQNPNLARAIYEAGHDLLSHSYHHQPIPTVSAQELQQDSIRAHQALTRVLGVAPPLLYRPPTLDYTDSSLNALFASGYKYVLSGIPSTHDYERTAGEVAEEVINLAHPGSIAVMHMSDNASARGAIRLIIPYLQEKGYSFAKLSDYLK